MAFTIARGSSTSAYVHTPFLISFDGQQVLAVYDGFGIPQCFLVWRQFMAFGADLFMI